MKYLISILWLTITAVLCIISYQRGASSTIVVSDTIEVVKYDTIVRIKPIVVSSKEIGIKSYRVKLLGKIDVNDSTDSVEVELPITQKEYGDSTFRAWVSGFDAQLDSFRVYQPTRYITITTKQKPSKWSIGIQGGYGITPKGFQPYIGIGISKTIEIK